MIVSHNGNKSPLMDLLIRIRHHNQLTREMIDSSQVNDHFSPLTRRWGGSPWPPRWGSDSWLIDLDLACPRLDLFGITSPDSWGSTEAQRMLFHRSLNVGPASMTLAQHSNCDGTAPVFSNAYLQMLGGVVAHLEHSTPPVSSCT